MGSNKEKKQDEQDSSKKEAEDVKLLGFNKYYVLGIGLILAVVSMAIVFIMVEDKEQRNTYIMMGVYNLACVGLTYFMTNKLRESRSKRLEEKEKEKEWNRMPKRDKDKQMQDLMKKVGVKEKPVKLQ